MAAEIERGRRARDWRAVAPCVLVVQCVVLLLLADSARCASAATRGAYYDDPNYDMGHDLGMGESFPLPNAPQDTSGRDWRANRRRHRPDSPYYQYHSQADRLKAGVGFGSSSSSPVLAEMESHRSMPHSRIELPDATPSVLYGSSSDPYLNTLNARDTRAMRSNMPLVNPDDPFGMADSGGVSPIVTHQATRTRTFQAPALTEVMSQIKEIVAHPHTNPKPGNLHHIFSSVVSEPSEAPPPPPPPIPGGLNSGPPLPAFVQTSSVPVRSATSGYTQPLRVVSPEEVGAGAASLIERQSNTHTHTANQQHHKEPEAEKMRFRLEVAQPQTVHHAAPSAPQPRDPSGMPFVDAPPTQTKARAFIEEMAGVRKHVSSSSHSVIVVPRPAVRSSPPNKVLDSFRVWE